MVDITLSEFHALTKVLMCSDNPPKGREYDEYFGSDLQLAFRTVKTFADKKAIDFGYANWIDAYLTIKEE